MMFWQASLYFEVLLPTYRGQRNRDPLWNQNVKIVLKSLKYLFFVVVYFLNGQSNLPVRLGNLNQYVFFLGKDETRLIVLYFLLLQHGFYN